MMLAELPFLGVGLGYRTEFDQNIGASRGEVDFLEVISEQCFATLDAARLIELSGVFPLVPHGVELSIGTEGALDVEYLELITKLVRELHAPWFSDHLCFTRAGGVSLGSLNPLQRTRSMARDVAAKAQEVQDLVGVPFLLENISYLLAIPGELSEAEFMSEVMSHCSCGILLDLANVYINSQNHGFEPSAWISALPLDRVVQIHLAGGQRRESAFFDTHGAPVHEEVWTLLERVVREMPNLKGILIERDSNYPENFGELTAELARARRILTEARLHV